MPKPLQRRVLLVEDEALMRSLLVDRLQLAGFETLGCASAVEAIDLVASFDPDAVVSDISLGAGTNGLDLVRALAIQAPHLAFVLLSNYEASHHPVHKLKNLAYLRKSDISDPAILIEAIETVLTDKSGSKESVSEQTNPLKALTRLQNEILGQIASGASNVEIARMRGTSLKAVEMLINRTYRALGIERGAGVSQRVSASRIYMSNSGEMDLSQ